MKTVTHYFLVCPLVGCFPLLPSTYICSNCNLADYNEVWLFQTIISLTCQIDYYTSKYFDYPNSIHVIIKLTQAASAADFTRRKVLPNVGSWRCGFKSGMYEARETAPANNPKMITPWTMASWINKRNNNLADHLLSPTNLAGITRPLTEYNA